MENEKSAAFTLKNTNERIDKIESLMEKDGDRLASLKSSLFSLIVFVIAITLIFLSLFVFTIVKRPEVKEENEEWLLFKTLSFPSWLEIEKNEDTISVIVEGKKERTLYNGDEYLSLPYKTKIKAEITDDSFLIYGNGILYGGYRNKAT
ncbi:MAG: hypothetical protein MR687_08290 [Spirochaetales bacterium]|nr:hypothetical protein [Spirochaetales bacterium]